jgi:hypothetical protein
MENKIPQPRMVNSNIYISNYESIEWRRRGTYCFDCGKTFKDGEDRKNFDDGHARCVNCNTN